MYMPTRVNNFGMMVLRNREDLKGVLYTRKLRNIAVNSINHPLN
jgi:hypothetical protein